MGVDPTTDTTDSVRTSSWTCSYTVRVKQPVADRIVRTSFRPVPTRMPLPVECGSHSSPLQKPPSGGFPIGLTWEPSASLCR